MRGAQQRHSNGVPTRRPRSFFEFPRPNLEISRAKSVESIVVVLEYRQCKSVHTRSARSTAKTACRKQPAHIRGSYEGSSATPPFPATRLNKAGRTPTTRAAQSARGICFPARGTRNSADEAFPSLVDLCLRGSWALVDKRSGSCARVSDDPLSPRDPSWHIPCVKTRIRS